MPKVVHISVRMTQKLISRRDLKSILRMDKHTSAIEVTTYGGHGSGKVIPTTFMADTVVMPDPERATLVLVTGEVVVCEQSAIAVTTYGGHGSGEVVVCEQSAIAVTTYGGHGSGRVIPTAFMADTVVMPDPERATLVLVTGEVVVCEQSAIAVTTYGGHGSGKVIPTAFMADTVVMPDPERATLVLVTVFPRIEKLQRIRDDDKLRRLSTLALVALRFDR
ncbi:hypothetical protein RCL_jg15700.t1 [Rhizophagus clarus]|uniref:Uncharacterized protein n=1 Tax=Rhizophagus clarus TaxID=94130 RepID=A0A8H3MCT3_9GLOM|nr:hypothetical protein RCL_jg15700.t1 [Rhizophagus clarus]